MANTLGNYNPLFYAQEALIQLQNSLGLANTVHRGFEDERKARNLGQTINIRKPSTMTAQAAPGSVVDLATETETLTLNSWQEVRFAVPDDEMAFTGERIIADHIQPAAYELANKIDLDGAALFYKIPWSVDSGGSVAIGDLTAAYRTLFDNGVPMNPEMLYLMIGGSMQEGLQNLDTFNRANEGAGGSELQVNGTLGRKFGFNIFANQNTPTHVPGTMTDVTGALTAAVAKGATTIPIDGMDASGVVKKGDTFIIAGNTQRYAVTADVTLSSGAGTIAIFPAAVVAYSDNDVVTLEQGAKTRINMAYHKNCMALAMAELPAQKIRDVMGAQVETVFDDKTGLAIRARQYYDGDNSRMIIVLDVLYGWRYLDANLAVRIRTAA